MFSDLNKGDSGGLGRELECSFTLRQEVDQMNHTWDSVQRWCSFKGLIKRSEKKLQVAPRCFSTLTQTVARFCCKFDQSVADEHLGFGGVLVPPLPLVLDGLG